MVVPLVLDLPLKIQSNHVFQTFCCFRTRQMALRTPSVLVSTSNEFDNLARYMQHYVELSQQQQQQAQAVFNVIEVQYSPDNEPQGTGTDQSAVQPNPDDVLQ